MPERRNTSTDAGAAPKRPRGRPRKTDAPFGESAFAVIADKRVPFTSEGKRQLLSPLEALEQQTYNSACEGKPSAIVDALKMIEANGRARLPEYCRIPRIRLEHEPPSIDDVLVLLGLAASTYVPERWEGEDSRTLQLDPGAVSYALQAHPPKGLSPELLEHIRARTRNPEQVGWPKVGDK